VPLNGGDLLHYVTITRDTISHVLGAEMRSPETLASVWARVEILSGHEAWKAQQVDATANAKVTMRYRSNIRASDRIEWRGWRLEIKAVVPDEVDGCSVVLMCEGKRIS
jgi:SPP1 family predicted phage head-tail adaptor